MKIITLNLLIALVIHSTFARECGSNLKPEKLVVVGVWKRGFDNSTSQYRISDEDLSVRGYERANIDKGSSTIQLARHPEGCILNDCGIRLSAMMQINGAILHTDYRLIRMNDSTMNNIDDEFYCAQKSNFCGADVPIYRLVKHSLTGPHYAYSFDNIGQSLPGYEKEFFPLCFGWRQTPSVVLFNSSDDGVCLTLPNIKNGRIVYSNNQLNVYSIGTTATLQCDHGYVGNGETSSLLCTKNGWYPKKDEIGSCISQESKIPLPKQQQLVVASDVIPSTSSSSSCPIPASTPNGNIVYSANVAESTSKTSVPSATRATVLCSLGFVPTTSVTSSKCVDGEWQPALPTCLSLLDLKCPILSAPRNGELIFPNSTKQPYSLDSTISLKCDRNYFGLGNLTAKCTSTGWDQKIGRCEPVGIRRLSEGHRNRKRRQVSTGTPCSAISTPANGNLLYMQSNPASEYSSGTSAYLMCNLGFSLSGSVSSLCSNGQWSPSIGQCTNALSLGQTAGNCDAIAMRTNGTISYSTIGTYTSGTVATLTCNLMNSVSGSATSTCLSGIWNPTLGNCISSGGTGTGTTCPNPTVINGQITYSQGNTFDLTRPSMTTATLTCNSGYSISGTSQSTCINGIFTPTLGTCTFGNTGTGTTTCPNPTVINGQITYSQGNTFDLTRPSMTVATLTCNSGYTLSGTSQSTCTNGAFTPTLGTCNLGGTGTGTGTTCPNPTVINGQITYSQGNTFDLTRPSMTTATLTCNSGYTLSGTSQSTCTNGIFQPTLGTCNIGGTGTGTGTTCPNPTVINGQITYSQGNTFDLTRPAMTTATLTCNSGYTISGTSQSTCTNGVFQPTLGTCNLGGTGGTGTGIQCTAMIAPLGGNVTYSNGGSMGPFPSGTTVTGTCTNGGAITGSTTSTCSNGMWSPAFLGTCSLIGGSTTGQCSAPTIPSGAQATYSPFSLSTTSFTSGTIATVTCTTGGTLIGTSTCTNGLWSPSIIGTCNGSGTGNTCSTLTRPVGETVTYDGQTSFATSFNSGVIARVTCTNGTQIGQSTCLLGQWTPQITATCSGSSTSIGTQCISAIAPANSQINYSDGSMVLHSAGTTATLTCLNSATLTGNGFATCSNGVWTPTLGTCTSSGTGNTGPCYTPPLTPTGATLTYSAGYFAPWTSGSSATLSCPAGQTVVGTTVTYCTNAAWSPALGTCSGSGGSNLGQGCTPLTAFSGTLTNGRMSYTPMITATIPFGTVVNIVCYTGYTLTGNSIATCTQSGWSPSQVGSCVQQQQLQQGTPLIANQSCLAMSTPTYGTLSYSVSGLGPFPTSTTVTLRCDTNYSVSPTGGTITSTCNNGLWYPSTLATCQRALKEVVGIACPAGIPPVLGATMSYSNAQVLGPYPAATVVTATCQAGYVPTGIMTSTCTNGIWSPASLGLCELTGNEIGGTNCGRLGDPLSGTLVYSALGLGPYPTGTSATVLCNIGTTLSGSPTTVCSNGVWNPLPGTCIATVLKRQPVKAVQNLTSSADTPEESMTTKKNNNGNAKLMLSGETCPPPVAPAFGEITFSGFSTKGHFDDGTTAALKCNLGYKPTGASFSTCRKGSFRPILGKCANGSEVAMPGVCVPLTPPKNSRVVYIQSGSSLDFEDGTTALLYCEEGYAVTGIATLQCQNAQWEPATGFGMCDTI